MRSNDTRKVLRSAATYSQENRMIRIHASLLTLAFVSTASGCFVDDHIGDSGNGDGGLPTPADTGVGGGATESVIAQGAAGAKSMAVDSTNVYWLYGGDCPSCSHNSAGLLTVPKSGGTPTSLLTIAPRLYDLALDDQYVYVTHQGAEILRVPKAGGAAETIVSGVSAPFAIDVDDTYVYWSTGASSGGTISRAPKDGSGSASTLVAGIANPWDLKVDGTTLYYSEMNLGRIMSVPKGGGAPQVLASGWAGTGNLALDATNVYFDACATAECDTPSLMTVLKTGGTAQQLAASAGGEGNLVVGPNRVLWAHGAVVQSVVKTGGALVGIASDTNGPFSVSVDADESHVYWLDFYTGSVSRTALP